MGLFGWSYPPGCNCVPDDEIEDEHPAESDLRELLESKGVDGDVCDKACDILAKVVSELRRLEKADCPVCLEAMSKQRF